MNVVSTGLYNLGVSAGNFNTAIGGRLYFQYAPQSVIYPYCIHWLVTDTYEPNFVEDYQVIIIQFDIYSKNSNASEIYTIGGYLTTLFDDSSPTITGWTVIDMKREYAVPPEYDTDLGVWKYTFQYRLMIEKNRS